MVIFNSYVSLPEGNYQTEDPVFKDFSKDDIIGHFRTIAGIPLGLP